MIYSKLGMTNLKVSRLGLGTAEIGFAYGIGPRSLPSEDEAIKLLNSAVELGITYFDTASLYGLAEERIGRSGILKNRGVVVGTKCGNFLDKKLDLSPEEMKKTIGQEIGASLKNLKTDHLQLLLFHGGTPELIINSGLMDFMQKMKTDGTIGYIGISTRGEEAPIKAIESGVFDVVQTAYSILDQRMRENVLSAAEKKGVGIINRSVLLKGSLTQAVKYLPAGLELLMQNSAKAETIAVKNGMDLPTLAIRLAISYSSISTSLVGTNRLDNLSKSVAAVESGALSNEILAELYGLGISDPKQVDPALWPPLL